MDQFRQVGEVLGGIKALMVLKHEISINQRQCSLLLHIFNLAFETISEEISQNLKLEEKNTKWKSLENPLRELHRIMKEGEMYIRYCLDIKDWWGKVISLHQNIDCVEFHIHNLLCCFTIIIEAIETCGEISGIDHDDMQKRRLMIMRKYDKEWNDPKIFQWKYGKYYLVSREISNLLTSAWREDRWILLETIREKRNSNSDIMAKYEQRLADFFIKKLNGLDSNKGKLLPAWILLGAKDFNVKRRLGSMGSHHKEIFWMGESFALRNVFGEVNEQLQNEISLLLSLSHPNTMQYLCGFYDDERKEGFIVMELMNKCLADYVKENSGQRKRVPFSLPVAVDIMLQIARGMEYLHSKKIYHGHLSPSSILLKARNVTSENYFYVKVTGFGLTSIKSYTSKNQSNQNGKDFVVWHAPEVLPEKEQQQGGKFTFKNSEKADVYSFGMLCFMILTGKTPFEEAHLQEDMIGRNIRAGERPLFPYTSPKFLVNLTRKCWQNDPFQRPSFSSICRILRYMKKCLVINPDHGQLESPPPLLDYCEIESGYSKLFPSDGSYDLEPVSQIPFQMFAYKLVEKEKTSGSSKEKTWDLAIEVPSSWGDLAIDQRSTCSELQERKSLSRIGVDQRSVSSEKPWRRTSPRTPTDQRTVFSENLWIKTDQTSVGPLVPDGKIFLQPEVDQRSNSLEIVEQKPISNDQRSDSSDQKPEGISGCLETEEGKILPDDGNLFDTESQEKITSFTSAIHKLGGSMTRGRKIGSKFSHIPEKNALVRANSDSSCSKKPGRKLMPTIASSDSELGSVSPEHSEEKNIPKKSSDQRSVRSENLNRKSLVKTKVVAAKTSMSPGRERIVSPRSSPIRVAKANSPNSLPRAAATDQCHRCSKSYRESRMPVWL